MKQKIKTLATSEKTKTALVSMKPQKNIWGFLGVVLFFILPEIVAFIWGAKITDYSQQALLHSSGSLELYYQSLVFLFEEGGSWINLVLGVTLLIWLFF